MMSWMLAAINFLLKTQEPPRFWIICVLGYVFILIGGGLGLFFLFQFLVPLIGYLESGAILSLLLMGGGLLILLLNHKKPSRPIDNILGEAQEVFKQINIQKILQENGPKIIIFSFISGILLSQLTGKKKFTSLKNVLKKIVGLNKRIF
jgi:hypothetical protein